MKSLEVFYDCFVCWVFLLLTVYWQWEQQRVVRSASIWIFNALYTRTRKPAAKTFLIATEDLKWLKLHLDYVLAEGAWTTTSNNLLPPIKTLTLGKEVCGFLTLEFLVTQTVLLPSPFPRLPVSQWKRMKESEELVKWWCFQSWSVHIYQSRAHCSFVLNDWQESIDRGKVLHLVQCMTMWSCFQCFCSQVAFNPSCTLQSPGGFLEHLLLSGLSHREIKWGSWGEGLEIGVFGVNSPDDSYRVKKTTGPWASTLWAREYHRHPWKHAAFFGP